MGSELFQDQRSPEKLQRRILEFLNSQPVYLSPRTVGSPRAVDDGAQLRNVADASFVVFTADMWHTWRKNRRKKEAVMLAEANDAIAPTDQDARTARTSSEALAPVACDESAHLAHVHLRTDGGREAEIDLPLSAVRLLLGALQEMAKGNAVALLPVAAELTTRQAAGLLRVSHPLLIKMLDTGKLPYRKVGAHRRVRYDDLSRFAEAERSRRMRVMEELVEETERLGLYE